MYVVNKEGRQSFLDFDLFSLKWNERVADMEAGKIPVVGINFFRKTAAHLNPFRTAVSFWGQSGTNYLEFECLVPKTGLDF